MSTATTLHRPDRRIRLTGTRGRLAVVGATLGVALSATVALAPSAPAAVTALCTGYTACNRAGYSDGGYGAKSGNSYWGLTPGHFATSYVAYRESYLGATTRPSWVVQGDSAPRYWGSRARAAGVPVDDRPAAGAIAWWDSNAGGKGVNGHVGYVEQVGPDYVVVSEDSSASTGDFRWRKYTAPNLPSGYIHYTDRDLYYVKTSATGSGTVEVRTATARSSWASGTSRTSRFSTADAANGVFQVSDGDLYFVKTRSTGSGRVEVHRVTRSSGYRTGSSWATALSVADGGNGTFQLVGSDLYFVKTRSTGSGRIEVHVLTQRSGYGTFSRHAATRFAAAEAANGTFQMVGADLWLIKTANTASGRIELFDATGASGYTAGTVSSATWIGTGDRVNGTFHLLGRDLWFLKTRSTGTGRIEIHNAPAATGYGRPTVQVPTRFGVAEGTLGQFQLTNRE